MNPAFNSWQFYIKHSQEALNFGRVVSQSTRRTILQRWRCDFLNHRLPRVLGGAPKWAGKFRTDTLAVFELLSDYLLMKEPQFFLRVYALLEPGVHSIKIACHVLAK